jgi:uncharacterized protein involved in exopolysaccharide biosynthesis
MKGIYEDMPEEEIDLRELINVLIKRKWLIIGIFIMAVLAAAIVSFFVLKPVYEAKATLFYHEPEYEVTLEPKIRTQAATAISMETYEHLIKTKDIEEMVIEQLSLDKPPYEMNFLNLDRMLTLNIIKNSNLIQMKITLGNPELAQRIVNLWADLFVERNKYIFQQDNERAAQFIEKQLNEAEEELIQTEDEIRKFNATNQIDILQKEISKSTDNIVKNQSKIEDLNVSLGMEKNKVTRLWQQLVQSRLAYYNSRKANLQLTGEQQLAKLTKVVELLSGLGDKIILSKSIVEDHYYENLLQEFLKNTGMSSSRFNLNLASEEINPNYIQLTENKNILEMNIADNKKEIDIINNILAFLSEENISVNNFLQKDINSIDSTELIDKINNSLIKISEVDSNIGNEYMTIINSIASIESIGNEIEQLKMFISEARNSIVNLKDELANQGLIKARLDRIYKNENNIFDILTQKNEEIKIALSAESANLEVAKYAYIPESPIKPNKKLNIAIGGVLGLFMGIFIAFFLEFWQSGKK